VRATTAQCFFLSVRVLISASTLHLVSTSKRLGCHFMQSIDVCNGEVVATNEHAESISLGSIEGIGISELDLNVSNTTLQFNHNYTLIFEVGVKDRIVLRLGELSMFSFIVELDIVHLCTRV